MEKPETGSFNLKIDGIKVNGVSVSGSAEAFLDSGTTWTYLPEPLYEAIY